MSRMLSHDFIENFATIAKSPEPGLAHAALLIARLEYSDLDASRYLEQLDRMGGEARERIGSLSSSADLIARVTAVNSYLFDDQGFTGNQSHYDDPRNNLLNAVLDRRTGIPITLALVYIEVARRAGLRVEGINFPGHFLLKLPGDYEDITDQHDVIVDPFHGGAILSEPDCRKLLRSRVGEAPTFDRRLLIRATKQQIIIRMLVNLKRLYVRMRSFPQGRAVTELLLALDPSALTELRDRGLLAYHLNDFAAALRDLEAYLRFTSHGKSGGTGEEDEDEDDGEKSEHAEIWEHVKALRRRVASLN
jgi:regulator of sirC expression with transglutaminase-like and TPR domain